MARYSLVLETYDGELKYVKDGNMSTKMDLEYIDRYTSQFENLGQFLTQLQKKIHFDFNPKEVYISYKAKGETKKLDLIFANNDIKNRAIDIINKKKNNQEELLNVDEKLIKLKNKLKAYALTSDTFAYIGRTTRIFPYHVYTLLKDYRKTNKMESTARQAELQQIEDSILHNLRDYKIYRKICLWEKVYENYRKQNKIPEVSEFVQLKLVDTFEKKKETPEIIDEEPEVIIQPEEIPDSYDNNIKNVYIKELYDKCDGDIDLIIGIAGTEFMEDLSDEDQLACGYTDYKRRMR